MQAAEREPPIYRSLSAEVSKTLVKIAGVSYPVNGIGSVGVVSPDRHKHFLGGGLLFILGLFTINGTEASLTGILLVGGIIFVALGLQIPHILILRTASGDHRALFSRDAALLQSIKFAIEEAVAQRG